MAYDGNFGAVQVLIGAEGTAGATSFVDEASNTTLTRTTGVNGGPAISTNGNGKYGNNALAYTSDRSGSVELPQNSDYAWLASSAPDWTIEFWFMTATPTSGGSQKALMVDAYSDATHYVSWNVLDGHLSSNGLNAGSWQFTADSGTYFTASTWHHVAICRDAGTLRIYIDGVQKISAALSTFISGNIRFSLGADNTAGYTLDYAKRVDEARFSRMCRYPSGTTFTAPTEAYPRAGTALFLPLETVGTSIIESAGARTITNTGTASITSGTGHAGGANALYLDGSTQYLTTPADPGMAMVGMTFTMEGWFNLDTGATGALRPLINNGDGTSGGFKIEITSGNFLKAYVYCGSTAITITGATTVTANAYHHFALNKASGDVFRLFLDGVEQGTSVTQGGNITAASATQIGYDGTNFFKGYLDDIRVLKGLSIYDAAFTPPTYNLTQLPATNGTGSPSLNAMTSSATQQAIKTTSPALSLNKITSSFTRTIYPWGAPALSLNAMTSSGVGRVPLVLATMSDTLNLSTTALPSLTAAVTMTSSLSLTTPTTAGNLLDGSLLSSLLSSTSLVGSHDQSVVWTEHLVIISTVDKSATGTAWVINANTKAVSMYDEYPFHSLIPHQGKFYGISDEGLFLLEGDDDDGSKIDAFVLTKKTDFGNTTLNRVPYVYAGADAPDGLTVAVHTDEGRFEYSAPATDGLQNTRAKIGMGLRSRFWQVELRNVDGGDMTIESLEVMPTKQDRRIK